MAEKTNLTLTGRQRDETGQETVTSINVQAVYYEKNQSLYILYEETQADDNFVITNMIKFKDPVLELTRRGSFRSRMVFEPGKIHRADYVTPYGTLPLDVATKTLTVSFLEGRMELLLEYTLTCDGQFLSECALSLSLDPL